MKQLDKKSIWLFFFQGLFSWVFLLLFVGSWVKLSDSGAVSTNITKGFFVFILLLSFVFSYLVARLSYSYYRYELTDKGFRKESGIIWKSYVTIPYDRIQNVDIYRGIMARLLGLSDIHIHTAGVSGVARGEGRLPGLSKRVAEQVRDEVLSLARTSRNNQGL